jgi:hypothetical protein
MEVGEWSSGGAERDRPIAPTVARPRAGPDEPTEPPVAILVQTNCASDGVTGPPETLPANVTPTRPLGAHRGGWIEIEVFTGIVVLAVA